jgi:hypothetical protein
MDMALILPASIVLIVVMVGVLLWVSMSRGRGPRE